jgi:group II intron reverse transcriptase/maturase/CRISPR-associated endonuclease Cas1
MLSEPLEKIFTPRTLLEAWERYADEPDAPEVRNWIENGRLLDALAQGYVPDPMRGFEIPKHDGTMRQIAMASTASKVIQIVLSDALNRSIDFSDKSYAFRRGKGPIKAIRRTVDFLNRYDWVAKADIESFFDTIDHRKLIRMLEKLVTDKRVVLLISTFVQNGMLRSHTWIDKTRGVYQGDALSPVLSNIYLHPFDRALEERGIDFVRFADDMIFFAHSRNAAKTHLHTASKILAALSLRFGADKSYVASVEKGFEYLGLRFVGERIAMDNERLMEKISALSRKTRDKPLEETVAFFNDFARALKSYYLKLLSDTEQLEQIEDHMETILVRKIAEAKRTRSINRRDMFVRILSAFDFVLPTKPLEKKQRIEILIDLAYESLRLEKPLRSARKQIDRRKRRYLQDQITSTELILSSYGLYVGASKGKVVVKEYGKVVKKMPINWLRRIVVLSHGVSLSSHLVFECARRKIDIDFIDRNTPAAQLVSARAVSHELHLKQLEMKNTTQGLEIARAIVKAKMKNQINLLKYYARYRAKADPEVFAGLEELIGRMSRIYGVVERAENVEALMGMEGSHSGFYWRGFGLLIDRPEFRRESRGALDAVNQALNYGYAFLYHRIQSALIRRGVNLYHSFLHVQQAGKPTLVYDLIEPFRQPVVDLEIVSILNRGGKLSTVKGRLTKESVRIVSENVQERLATPTRWRKGKYQLQHIIDDQALELAHVIKGIKSRFKPFVVRY